MKLQNLLDAVNQQDNLENNFNLVEYWVGKQQFYKAKEWANKAIISKESAIKAGTNLFIVNKLNHLLVKIIYLTSGENLEELKKSLPIIIEVKMYEGENYNGINGMDFYMLTTAIERKINILEKGKNHKLTPFR